MGVLSQNCEHKKVLVELVKFVSLEPGRIGGLVAEEPETSVEDFDLPDNSCWWPVGAD